MAFTEELRSKGQRLGSLPDDVIGRILGLLPLKVKLVCRCVCWSWNSILSEDIFLGHTSNAILRSRSSGFSNACFMLTTRGPLAYLLDPHTNFWHELRKPSCPGASVLAASHALVCVGNQVSECRSLIIFNLLSGTWKPLPNMLHVGLLHKVTIAVDPLSHSYVVVVTGEDTSEFRGRSAYRLHTEVYDSVSASWGMAGDAMPDAKFGSDPGVWHNGIFYCITEMPYGVTAFNLAKGLWMELSVEMPVGISHPSLVSCGGQLMMVSIQEDNADCFFNASLEMSDAQTTEQVWKMPWHMPRSLSWSGPFQMWATSQLRSTLSAWPSIALPLTASAPRLSSLMPLSFSPPRLSSSPPSPSPPRAPTPPHSKEVIRIWSLDNSKQWVMIEEMPAELCTEFLAHLTPKTRLVCAGVGSEVCITSYQSPNTVIYNSSDRGWRCTASDPAFPRNRDMHLLGFTVRPDRSCAP